MNKSLSPIKFEPKQIWLISLALLSFMLVNLSGHSIPRLCIFFKLTGIPCLFCGMTRGITSIFQLNLIDAIQYHSLSPFILVACIMIFVKSAIYRKTISFEFTYLKLAFIVTLLIIAWLSKLTFIDKIYW